MVREEVIKEIIERELAMFLSTQNEGGTASCQERPDTFRLMRRMAHEAHEDAYLACYLGHLNEALDKGRNFMVEKYGRMDNRLPPLSDSPLLDEIADAEAGFMESAAALYPALFKPESWKGFRRYLRCELETLSPECLELYAGEIRKAVSEKRNPVLERYEWLAKHLGKTHLSELGASGNE